MPTPEHLVFVHAMTLEEALDQVRNYTPEERTLLSQSIWCEMLHEYTTPEARDFIDARIREMEYAARIAFRIWTGEMSPN